jgi:hypothetical protein
MVEDILLTEPAPMTAEPPKENAVPEAAEGAAAPSDPPRVLSPMHTSAGANVDAAAPEEAPASAVKSKSNVFGKLLSGGKKFLKTKRTPAKSATKPTAKSASRPRNGSLSTSTSSPKSAGSSDAAPMEPPSPTPFSIAAAVDDNEAPVEPEKVVDEVENVAAAAEAAPEPEPESEPVVETALEASPAEQQKEIEETSAPESQTQMEEDQVQEEEEVVPQQPEEAPAVTVTATAEQTAPPSPEAPPEAPASPNMMESSMMESPQKPTLDSVVRMSTAPSTAADILAAAQSTYTEPAPVTSPTHDDMEMSVMMSPVAASSLPPPKAPSPVAKAPRAPPVVEAPAPAQAPTPATANCTAAPAPAVGHAAPTKPVSAAQQQQQAVASAAAAAVAAKSSKPSSAFAFSGPGLTSKSSSSAAPADKKIPANMSTKPTSHALKLEQIREKQRLATLQKEKEMAEKQAERDKRIQEQKERAISEKLALKQSAKAPAEAPRSDKSPVPSSSSAAPATVPKPTAPAVAAKPAASVLTPKSTNVPAPTPAAAPKPAVPATVPASAAMTKTSELSKMERNAEEEAQRLVAQSAAARAAAEEYDSYCMSEPEEQEEDNSDDEAQRGKAAKRVPAWATKENLRAALQQQCERKIDPDGIFYECNTCILEDIFERTSKRYAYILYSFPNHQCMVQFVHL